MAYSAPQPDGPQVFVRPDPPAPDVKYDDTGPHVTDAHPPINSNANLAPLNLTNGFLYVHGPVFHM
jgi:hypothetical protein